MKKRLGEGREWSIVLLSIATIVASSLISSSAYNVSQATYASAAAPTLGLVGYWPFDEGSGTTANDSSGSVNHGSLLNGPVWRNQADCKAGGCLSFDGVDDMVRVDNSSSLQITGDITISIWIKPMAVSANQVLVHKSREFHLGHIEPSAPYRIKWHHASQGASGDLANSANIGQWQHIVLVRDNTTKQIKGYKNGALELTSSYTTDPTLSTNPVGIASRYSGGEYFNGLIDEVRIYNRTLTEGEIAELFNEETGCLSSVSPTSQFFEMNGGAGSFGVSASGSCSWTATSNANWITIVSADSGTGNGSVSYEVRENFTASARTGTLDIDGQIVNVIQDGGLGEECGYTISPTQNSFPATGGTGSVNVTSEIRCAWQAISNASWITITSENAGIGDEVVTYTVGANPGSSSRKGTMNIAGQVFNVKQKGQLTGLATLTLNPTAVAGGSSSQGTVTLSGPAPSGGATVLLSSSNTSVATVPPSVIVPTGATSANFTVSTNTVSVSTQVTITGDYGGTTRTDTLTVSPPPPGIGSALPTRLPESTGTTFYVATTGSDSNTGTLASPWRTIQKALNTLQPGQKAYVRAGTYPEALQFDRAGTATNPITIEAYPGEAPIIDGGFVRRVLDIGSTGAYLRVRRFIVERSAFESGGHIDVYGHHVEIVGNEIRNGRGKGVYTDESSHHVHIIANRIHHNGTVPGSQQDHGIYLQGSDHFVANNVIHDHPDGFGIQVYDLNHRSIIVSNTITHSAHSGIVVGGSGGVDNITIRNNILAYNSRYGVQHDSTCPTANVIVDHNVIFSNSSGTVQTGCGAVNTSGGNITSNPLFLDVTNRDLRIASGSPAIGAALLAYSMPDDFLGQLRDFLPDAGAYEFAGGVPPPPLTSTYYVAPTGDDSNPGTASQPFQTIQRAGNVVNPGDTVSVSDGVYTDTNADGTIVQINRGGSASQLVTFKAQNRWRAKLDGQNNTAKFGFNFGSNVGFVRIEGFDITGLGGNDVNLAPTAAGININDGGGNSQVVDNRIHHIGNYCNSSIRSQAGIFVEQTNVLIERNVIHDIGRLAPGAGCTYPPGFTGYKSNDSGIILSDANVLGTNHPGADNATILNNIFYNHRSGMAVYFYDGTLANVKILNNTFAHGNPYWYYTHIFFDSYLTDVHVKNNIFYEPLGGYRIVWDRETPTRVVVSNNIGNGTPGKIIDGGGNGPVNIPAGMTDQSNQFDVDPRFTDPTIPGNPSPIPDFHLRFDSPALGLGEVLAEVTADFEGTIRPQPAGTNHDIGAYEVSSGSLNPQAASLAFTGVVYIERASGSDLASGIRWKTYQFVSLTDRRL